MRVDVRVKFVRQLTILTLVERKVQLRCNQSVDEAGQAGLLIGLDNLAVDLFPPRIVRQSPKTPQRGTTELTGFRSGATTRLRSGSSSATTLVPVKSALRFCEMLPANASATSWCA